MDIKEFLALPHRFGWGGEGRPHPRDEHGRIYNDCTTFCASWVEFMTGIDPARDLRRTYATADGAHAIVDSAGGHVRFMAGRLEPIGCKRVQNTEDGDIGCVVAPVGMNEFSEIGAIRFGPNWVTIGPVGLVGKRLEMVAAWRLPL